MIINPRDKQAQAVKSAFDNWIASNRVTAFTEREKAQLYAVSIMAYRASNFWADNVAAVNIVPYFEGEALPEDSKHPLARICYSSGFSDVMRRVVLTDLFWGRVLLRKRRNIYGRTAALDWINPLLYTLRINYTNYTLDGFYLSPQAQQGSTDYFLSRADSVYFHGFDFDDDFDGVAPAEVGFLSATTEPEIAQTILAFFRNQAIPAGIAQPDKDGPLPNEEKANSLNEFLRRGFRGSANAGRTLVTSARWEWIQLMMPWKDLAMKELNEQVKHDIALAFGVQPEFFQTGQTTYAELEGKIALWRQSTLVPKVMWYVDRISEDLCSEYPGYSLEPDFSEIFQDDETEKLDIVDKKLDMLLISLGDAQLAMGEKHDPVFDDLYLVDGIGPVPKRELANIWRYKLGAANMAIAETVLDTDNTPAVPTLTDNALTPEADASKDTASGCIVLGFPNHPDLIALQERARTLCNDDSARWTDSAELHCTLLYMPAMTPLQAQMFKHALSGMDMPALRLNVGSLKAFDSVGEYALHYRIRRNTDLLELNESLYEWAQEHGIGLSAYSRPEQYTPHITVGYTDGKPPTAIHQGKIVVEPSELIFSYGDDVLLSKPLGDIIEGAASKAAQYIPDNAFSELKVAAKKGAAFIPDKLPVLSLRYIVMLKEAGIAQPDIIDAAKAHYLRVAAAKALQATRIDFEDDFADLLQNALTENINRRRFGTILRDLLRRYATQAYRDGLKDGGVDLAERPLTGDDLQRVNEFVRSQSQYVTAIGDAIYVEGTVSPAMAANKPEQWFNGSVYPAYLLGLESAADDGLFTWVLGNTEKHCKSCLALNGQIHRFSEFKKRGLFPKADKLECGPGKLCDCSLLPAPNATATIGSLDAVPVF